MSELKFSQDPTARGDEVAAYVREYYEHNRETWWHRWRRPQTSADNFMLGLVDYVRRVQREAEKQARER